MCWEGVVLCQGMPKLRISYDKNLLLTCRNLGTLLYKSFENTVGKGDIARNDQFLLFPRFLPVTKTFYQLYLI